MSLVRRKKQQQAMFRTACEGGETHMEHSLYTCMCEQSMSHIFLLTTAYTCGMHTRFHIAWFPAPRRGGKRAPGVHCSRMRQVSMVTCILLRYTKITNNFSLPPERPHCRAMLLARNIWKDLMSEIISL